jgi:hypothetical protein
VRVDNLVNRVDRYQSILTRYRDDLWNLAGVGKEFKEVDGFLKSVMEVVLWLDDMLCAELDPSQSVAKMFRKKQFTFQ